MAGNGVKSIDLDPMATVDAVLGNSGGTTGQIPVADLANQLIGTGPVSLRLNEIEGQITSGVISAATWPSLMTFSGSVDGAGAEVFDTDTGTHDQATSSGYDGTAVANAGRYRWKANWGRWVRIGDTGLSAKVNAADLAAIALSGSADDIVETATKVMMLASERGKLSGVEDGADVTDLANVAAALLTANAANNVSDASADAILGIINGNLRQLGFDDLSSFVAGTLGALAIKDTIAGAQVDDNALALGKITQIPEARMLGRQLGSGDGDVSTLAPTHVREMLNVENGADVTDLSNVATALLTSLTANSVSDVSTDTILGLLGGNLRQLAFDDLAAVIQDQIGPDLLDRANHTGAQAIDTVNGLQAALDGTATAAQGVLADSAKQPGDASTPAKRADWSTTNVGGEEARNDLAIGTIVENAHFGPALRIVPDDIVNLSADLGPKRVFHLTGSEVMTFRHKVERTTDAQAPSSSTVKVLVRELNGQLASFGARTGYSGEPVVSDGAVDITFTVSRDASTGADVIIDPNAAAFCVFNRVVKDCGALDIGPMTWSSTAFTPALASQLASIATGAGLDDNSLPLGKITQIAEARILGRAVGAGTGAVSTLGPSQVRTLAGLGALAVLDTIAGAQVDDNSLGLGKITQIAEARILGRAAGAGTGAVSTLSPSQLRTLAGLGDLAVLNTITAAQIGAGEVGSAALAAGAVDYQHLPNLPAATILGRPSGDGTGRPSALDSPALATILGLGTLAIKSTVGSGDIDDGTLNFAKLADLDEGRLLGRANGAGVGPPVALAPSQIRTLAGLGALAVMDTIAGAQVEDNSLALGKITQIAEARILGRAVGAGPGSPDVLNSAEVRTLAGLGALAVMDTIAGAQVEDNSLALGKITQIAEARILGRAVGAGPGSPDVLNSAEVRALAGLGALAVMDTIAGAQVEDNSLALGKITQIAEARILGRAVGAGPGSPDVLNSAEVRALAGLGALAVMDTIAGAQVDDNSLSLGKFTEIPGARILGRPGGNGDGPVTTLAPVQIRELAGLGKLSVLDLITAAQIGVGEVVEAHFSLDAKAMIDTRAARFQTGQSPAQNLRAYTSDLAGEPGSKADLSADDVMSHATYGDVLALTGQGLVAMREPISIDGLVIEAKAVLRRLTNPADPSGDSVELGVAWLSASGALIGTQVLDTETLTVSDGLRVMSGRVSRLDVGNVTAPPSSARSACFYVQSYGLDGVTAVHWLTQDDVTEVHSLDATNLPALIAAAQEATAAAEGAAALVNSETVASISDLQAFTRPTGTGSVNVSYADTAGDGRGSVYYYDAADTESADNGLSIIVGADGARWMRGTDVDGFDTRAAAVVLHAAGWRATDGREYRIQGFRYIGRADASAIPDLPGLVPAGDLFIDHWSNVVGDGSEDLAPAIELAMDYADSLGGADVWGGLGKTYAFSAITIANKSRLRGMGRSTTFAVHENLPVGATWITNRDINTADGSRAAEGVELLDCTCDGANLPFDRWLSKADGTPVEDPEADYVMGSGALASGISGVDLTAVVTDGVVTSVIVTDGGTGWNSHPTHPYVPETVPVWFTGGGGTGARGHATISGATIVSVTVEFGGSGYTSVPTAVTAGGYADISLLTDPSIDRRNPSYKDVGTGVSFAKIKNPRVRNVVFKNFKSRVLSDRGCLNGYYSRLEFENCGKNDGPFHCIWVQCYGDPVAPGAAFADSENTRLEDIYVYRAERSAVAWGPTKGGTISGLHAEECGESSIWLPVHVHKNGGMSVFDRLRLKNNKLTDIAGALIEAGGTSNLLIKNSLIEGAAEEGLGVAGCWNVTVINTTFKNNGTGLNMDGGMSVPFGPFSERFSYNIGTVPTAGEAIDVGSQTHVIKVGSVGGGGQDGIGHDGLEFRGNTFIEERSVHPAQLFYHVKADENNLAGSLDIIDNDLRAVPGDMDLIDGQGNVFDANIPVTIRGNKGHASEGPVVLTQTVGNTNTRFLRPGFRPSRIEAVALSASGAGSDGQLNWVSSGAHAAFCTSRPTAANAQISEGALVETRSADGSTVTCRIELKDWEVDGVNLTVTTNTENVDVRFVCYP